MTTTPYCFPTIVPMESQYVSTKYKCVVRLVESHISKTTSWTPIRRSPRPVHSWWRRASLTLAALPQNGVILSRIMCHSSKVHVRALQETTKTLMKGNVGKKHYPLIALVMSRWRTTMEDSWLWVPDNRRAINDIATCGQKRSLVDARISLCSIWWIFVCLVLSSATGDIRFLMELRHSKREKLRINSKFPVLESPYPWFLVLYLSVVPVGAFSQFQRLLQMVSRGGADQPRTPMERNKSSTSILHQADTKKVSGKPNIIYQCAVVKFIKYLDTADFL